MSPLHYLANPKETAENGVIMEKLTLLARQAGEKKSGAGSGNVRLFMWCVTASGEQSAAAAAALIELSEAITASGEQKIGRRRRRRHRPGPRDGSCPESGGGAT